MKQIITAAVLCGCAFFIGMTHSSGPEQAGAALDQNEKIYRHVVAFKFKESASEKDIEAIVDAFSALPKKIDSIIDYEHGVNVSPEDHAKGFTHCFIVTFKDKKGVEAYLPHAAHQEFVKLLKPSLEDVFVVDYWTTK